MLNRKLSNYIFYASLALIVFIIIIIRTMTLGRLVDDIQTTDNHNIQLQKQIDKLEELVQENKDIQASHLYELYDLIPNVYSGSELKNRTVAILEKMLITADDDTSRSVIINYDANVSNTSEMYEIAQEYYVVEVQVKFTTNDMTKVTQVIDEIFASDQLFILRDIDYTFESSIVFTEVQINFYAIYDVDIPIEEES